MQIEVVLESQGKAEPGVDYKALAENIEAELLTFTKHVEIEGPTKKSKAAPAGAYGEDLLLQWLIDLAKDPAMAKAYAHTLIFAINEIISAVKPAKGDKDKPENDDTLLVRLKVLGKEIKLPATISAIKAFLESLGDN